MGLIPNEVLLSAGPKDLEIALRGSVQFRRTHYFDKQNSTTPHAQSNTRLLPTPQIKNDLLLMTPSGKLSVLNQHFKKDLKNNKRYDRKSKQIVTQSALGHNSHLISFINTMATPQVKLKIPKQNFKQYNNAVLSLPQFEANLVKAKTGIQLPKTILVTTPSSIEQQQFKFLKVSESEAKIIPKLKLGLQIKVKLSFEDKVKYYWMQKEVIQKMNALTV